MRGEHKFQRVLQSTPNFHYRLRRRCCNFLVFLAIFHVVNRRVVRTLNHVNLMARVEVPKADRLVMANARQNLIAAARQARDAPLVSHKHIRIHRLILLFLGPWSHLRASQLPDANGEILGPGDEQIHFLRVHQALHRALVARQLLRARVQVPIHGARGGPLHDGAVRARAVHLHLVGVLAAAHHGHRLDPVAVAVDDSERCARVVPPHHQLAVRGDSNHRIRQRHLVQLAD
mmetsp:Transcript_44685/g.85415  ORF Transcript_44685/g.85415 Transcript_44685/m.85415 type:complete len:232 (-) Transcript_44685:1084-1779(-)